VRGQPGTERIKNTGCKFTLFIASSAKPNGANFRQNGSANKAGVAGARFG